MRTWPRVLPVLLVLAGVACAVSPAAAGADELFAEARELAFSGHRAQARELCARILEDSPDYADVRILLGRLWAWDGKHARAREELLRVVDRRPDIADAWRALIDVELWSDRPAVALDRCDEALAHHPGDPDLLFRKARALADLDRPREALPLASEAARRRPDAPEMAALERRLRSREPDHKFSSLFSYESFNDGTAPWRELYVQYDRKFPRGSVIGRVNFADRFGRSDEQYEIDAYPKLGRKHYLYLNAGYSRGRVFPEWRYGAELYRKLPRKFEASLGFRRLEFSSSNVTLYTGTVGHYRGNYFIWLRPYFSDKDVGTSYSAQLFVRRYFGDPETYLTLIAGGGSSPDVDQITGADLGRLNSRTLRFDWQKRLAPRWVLKGKGAYRDDEFRNGRERESWELGIGFERWF